MTNAKKIKAAGIRHSGFVIDSSFVIRHSSFYSRAFTLIELVVVSGLILVLTGLVLSTVGYARKKGARARAETEIAAMSAALESYKADNAAYPSNLATNTLDAQSNLDPSAYSTASLLLYEKLSGDSLHHRQPSDKSYFAFKPNMLFPADQSQDVQYIQDPFGNS